MTEPADPAPLPPKPRKRWLPRLRFSLRTLVILVSLIGSGIGLWLSWPPWYLARTFPDPVGHITNKPLLSRDGLRVATVTASNHVVVWDARSGQRLLDEPGDASPHRSLVFSPDGTRLLATWDKFFAVWHISQGRVIQQSLDVPHSDSTALFSPDGEHLCMVSRITQDFQTWDLGSGKKLYASEVSKNQEEAPLYNLNWSSDGKHLHAVGDKAALVWDAATGVLLYRIHSDLYGASRSEDQAKADEGKARRAALASQSQQLKEFCELTRGREQGLGLRVNTGVTADGEFLLTNLDDTREVRVWNLGTGKHVRTFSLGKGDHVLSFYGGKNGLMMLQNSVTDKELQGAESYICYEVWDVKNATKLCDFTQRNKFGAFSSALYDDEVPRFVYGESTKQEIWDAQSGRLLVQHNIAADVHQSCRNRIIMRASTLYDVTEHFVDLKTGEIVFQRTTTGMGMTSLAEDGTSFVDLDDKLHVRHWRRRRPEYWWGIAWLPEFWLTALFAGALGWSVWRDRQSTQEKLEAAT
jgi:WD40 repeat protein